MSKLKRITLALAFGLLLATAILEGGARAIVAFSFAPDRARDLVLPYDALPFRPHPYIGWELTPSRISRDGEMSNPQGFRGPERPIAKKRGVYRVACLGGSTTFTQKVKEDETYPVQLEAALRRAWPGLEVEVLNAGVKGYTTAESLMNLVHKVLDHQPDAIVVYHAINDLYPRTYPGFAPDYSHCRRVWAPEEVEKSDPLRLLERTATYPLLRDSLTDYRKRGGLYYWVYPPEDLRAGVDPRTRSTTMAFRRNLMAMCRVARSRGIACVLVSQAQNPETIEPGDAKPLIAEMNEVTADVARAEQGLFIDAAKDFPGGDTYDPGDAVHMTGKGAGILAARIAEGMIAAGLQERRAAESGFGVESMKTFESVPARRVPLPEDELAALRSAQYLTPMAYRSYLPTPGATASSSGGIGPHDSQGFRRNDADAVQPTARRVLFLGGSATYGVGVRVEEAYPARFEAALHERGLKLFESWNGGVPGFTTAEEVAALHFQALPTSPEIVVITLGLEDAPPRTEVGYRADFAHLRKPFRFDLGAESSWIERSFTMPIEEGVDRIGSGIPLRALRKPSVPPPSDNRNARPGPFATYRNLRTLVDLARTHPGVLRVMLVVAPLPSDDPAFSKITADQLAIARKVADETHGDLVELSGTWGESDFLPGSYVPSVAGHQRIAEAIARAFSAPR